MTGTNQNPSELADTKHQEDGILLDMKPIKSINDTKIIFDHFEYIKIIEVFITKNGNIFAHCTICLFKTEIQNINSLLQHYIDSHAIYSTVNQNVDYANNVCSNYFDENRLKLSNKPNQAECNERGINFKSMQSEENTYQTQSGDYIDKLKSGNFVKESLNEECCQMSIEKQITINKLDITQSSLDQDLGNEIIYFDANELKEDYLMMNEEEYCDSIILEEDINENVQNKLLPSTTAENFSDIDHCMIISDLNIQKLDEEFYKHLAGLDPEQSLCQICHAKFRYISRHYKNQHPEIILCEIGKCFQTFNSLPELHIHYERFHNDSTHAFTCTICQYKTNSLHTFRFHYQRIHLNLKDFGCDFCDMKFFSNYEKTKHIRCHTGQKPYICETCNSKYTTKQLLNLHIQKYHSEPLFNCDVCNKKFYRKQTLKEHHMTKHTQSEKKVICEICGDRFFLRKHWKEHFNNIHNPNRKMWTCSDCGKSFSRNSNLRAHEAMHDLKN